MTEPAILIGGENDGRELAVSYPNPAHRIRIPVLLDPVRITFPTSEDLTPTYATLDYDLVTGPLGPPSRDDQGRLRYQLRR
jgi:hypothetical protein